LNPVLILTRNNLELTKWCVESVNAQDIDTTIWILDNDSTDGTREWLKDKDTWERFNLCWMGWDTNRGVSFAWNYGLANNGYFTDHCLVLNNDTIIPTFFYRELLSYDVPFVTGFEVQTLHEIAVCPWRFPLQPHPDFSAFLIRRSAWEAIGPFDERMKIYASDCDYHVRGYRLGVGMFKATVPYYHERSSTMRLAPPAERDEIAKQAGKDREVFQSIYGCIPGQPGYENLFK
jgi:GT2 family glycosyltransferase